MRFVKHTKNSHLKYYAVEKYPDVKYPDLKITVIVRTYTDGDRWVDIESSTGTILSVVVGIDMSDEEFDDYASKLVDLVLYGMGVDKHED